MGGSDRGQWRGGPPPIGSRLRVVALLFVLQFVLCLAAFFALAYCGVTGDQRVDVDGSLADVAALAALFTALIIVLSPLQWRLRRWLHWDEQQRR